MENWTNRIRSRHIIIAIILLGFIVYGKSIFYGYTHYDDTQILEVNQDLLSDISNIPKVFSTDVFISVNNAVLFYRPMLNLLIMLELQITKDGSYIFHLTNVLLHLFCSIFLYLALKQLNDSKYFAGMLAGIFCVHPLNSSAVVWIPGRNDTLLAFFILSSFLFFLKWTKTKNNWLLAGHIFLLLLAFLTKESAIFFPFLCLAFILFVRTADLKVGGYIKLIVLYALVISTWVVLRSLVPRSFELPNVAGTYIFEIFRNLPAILLYIGKVFFPFDLSIYPNLHDHSLVPGIIGVVILILLCVLLKTEWKMVLWGLGWFLVFILPSLVGGIYHEHRAYCAFVGLLFIFVQIPVAIKLNYESNIFNFAISSCIILLSLISFVYSDNYKDRLSYSLKAYLRDPSVGDSYVSIAGMFIDAGKDDSALKIIDEAISKKKYMRMVHRMRADILARKGKFQEADSEYNISLKIEPLHPYTYINYGQMCLLEGKKEKAVQLWKKSISTNPDFIAGYYFLVNYYLHTKNDPDSAMYYAKEIQNHGMKVLPELMAEIEKKINKK